MKRAVTRLLLVMTLLCPIATFCEEKNVFDDKAEVIRPKLLKSILPPYTDQAKKARIEGRVVLEVVITPEGRVKNVKINRGLGYGLDDSAAMAVTRHWRFQPATMNGQPVESAASIEVNFALMENDRPADTADELVDIQNLEFTGNEVFTEHELRLALEEKLSGVSTAKEGQVQNAISELYQSRGHIKVDVKRVRKDALCIREGTQYRVGKFEILGATVFPVEGLLKEFGLERGDVLDYSKIRNGLEKIRQMYVYVGLFDFSYILESTFKELEAEVDFTFTFQRVNQLEGERPVLHRSHKP